jgi:hypothetical protein
MNASSVRKKKLHHNRAYSSYHVNVQSDPIFQPDPDNEEIPTKNKMETLIESDDKPPEIKPPVKPPLTNYGLPIMNPARINPANVDPTKLNFKTVEQIPIDKIQDREGLTSAYKQPYSMYKYGDTLFIAGTQASRMFTPYKRDGQILPEALSDAMDDLLIPFHQTCLSQRYRDARKVIENDTSIKTIVGHSLGGAVSLQLQNDLKDRNLKVTTYGAPVFSNEQSTNRYRNPGDPISILDGGAVDTPEAKYSINPLTAHAFTNFSNVSQGDTGWFRNETSVKHR